MGVYFADLHIHSKYSRACSTALDFKYLEKYARLKGINLLGTGDFTHPKWIQELRQSLSENGDGIYTTSSGFPFVLQTEISLMYTQDSKGRKIHLILLAPDIETAEQITGYLKKNGRVDYDGRPIFGMSCPEFTENVKQISDKIEIIPAHAWTPWFGIFGSASGFDSVEECFQDQTKHIFALETGLSSDPEMNWRLSALDKYTLVSNSDLHSYWPWRLGRECNVIEMKKLTYDNLIKAIRTKEGFKQTIEFWPHEGKYHYDGHRNCNVVFEPSESIKNKNICPVCRKNLTIGVAHRVEQLADRALGEKPKNAVPFTYLIPLSELLAKLLGKGVSTKQVWDEYNKILKNFGTEYNVLLNATKEELEKTTHPKIAEIILKNRTDEIKWKPGYDGVYGEPIIEAIDCVAKEEKEDAPLIKQPPKQKVKQKSLADF